MNKYRMRRIGVANNTPATPPSLSDCVEMVLAQSTSLAADVLEALQARFAAGSSVLEPASMSAALEGVAASDAALAVVGLWTDADAWAAGFAAELRRLAYQRGHPAGDDVSAPQAGGFTSFDLAVLETHIEEALAYQEVARAVDDVMPLFDALVSAQLGWGSVQSTLNPLRSDVFVQALTATLVAWVPDASLRPLLMRPASVALGISLNQLLREACDWMLSMGINPVVALDGRAGSRRDVEAGTLEHSLATLEALRKLLGAAGPSPEDPRDFTNTLPASFVALQEMRLVEPMMRRLAARPTPVPAPETRPLTVAAGAGVRIGTTTASTAGTYHQVGRQLGGEVASLMLEQMVRDPGLAPPVRSELRQLEPVLVQLVQDDPRFFSDRQHPARQLLDRVVQLSRPYGSEDTEGVKGFLACVVCAVQSLLDGPGDAASFVGALEVLEEDCAAFEAMRRRQQQAVQDARSRAERRMALAQRISTAMSARHHAPALPEPVAAFLRGPWSQVLAEAHLRAEEGTLDPASYESVVEDLVASVDFPQSRHDYAQLVQSLPGLLARLNEGLVMVRYPQEPITLFLDQLSALHNGVLEEHRRAMAQARDSGWSHSMPLSELPGDSAAAPLAPLSPLAPSQPAIDPPAAEEPLPPSAPVALQDILVGAWVDLLHEGAWLRAQLTWIGHNRSLFMFVSGSGLSHAMSRRMMDRLEGQGRLRVAAGALPVDLVLADRPPGTNT